MLSQNIDVHDGDRLPSSIVVVIQEGVSTVNLDPGIQLCGLVVLSNIINGCDRFVAFN
jgi:hypothetical protein